MLAYQKQIALILIFTMVLVLIGIYGTSYMMKKVTQLPIDSMLSYQVQGDQLNVGLFGLDFSVLTTFFSEDVPLYLTRVRERAGEILRQLGSLLKQVEQGVDI